MRSTVKCFGSLKVSSARSPRDPRVEVRDHLRALSAHAEDHFSHEEWLLQSTSYPSYGWHRQQHDTVRRRLKLLVPLIEKGDQEATDLFLEFLSGWLQDHTGATDKMMGA
jgi:hemerythrin-like metal-binding protein